MKQGKFLGIVRLFRLDLTIAAGACVVLGELLAKGSLPTLFDAMMGFLTVFFISASALILNDYFDVDADLVNSPKRPIPSGIVKRSEALSIFILVTILGFILSLILGLIPFLVVIFTWFIGLLYNWKFKKFGLAGNLFVAYSVGMTFIFGGLVIGKPFEELVWFMATITFLIDLGEEIAADSLDYEGDRISGSRSLAVILGPERSMKISAGIFSLVIISSIIPFIFGWLKFFYLIPLLLLDAFILFSLIKLLNKNTEKKLRYIKTIYLGGFVVIIIFILFRIFL